MSDPTLEALLAEHAAREARADEGGGAARQARQRRLGRLTARERVEALVDPGSFVELGRHVQHRHAAASEALASNVHPGDGVVAGLGAVDGVTVAVYAHDPTVMRGALGREAARKVCRLLDLAGARRLPVVSLSDCDGVRVEEGTDAIDAYGEILRRTVRLKGRVPQLTLVTGLCVGAAAYNAALTDAVAMVDEQSYLFITGPKVTKVVTGEDVTLDELGGPAMHATKTGACHAVVADEAAGIAWLKALLGAIREPLRPSDDDPQRPTPEIGAIVPTAQRRVYDMKEVLAAVLDRGSMLELSARFAGNLITAFARIGGRAVAVVASQPMVHAGCLDVDASRKGAAFVSWADALGIPIVTLVDVPGYLPGKKQEEAGILPHGATLLRAYGRASVPMVCLVVRKSYGGASVLSFTADVRLALPTARVGAMGADATFEIVMGPEPPLADEAERTARAERRARFLAEHDHVYDAAETGYVDQVVAPEAARRALSAALTRLSPGGAT